MSDESADTESTLDKKKIGDPLEVTKILELVEGHTTIVGDFRTLAGYYARRDEFGRVVFDLCPTMHEHLTRPDGGPPNAVCLIHLGQLIPDKALNRKGKWLINISFEPYKGETK